MAKLLSRAKNLWDSHPVAKVVGALMVASGALSLVGLPASVPDWVGLVSDNLPNFPAIPSVSIGTLFNFGMLAIGVALLAGWSPKPPRLLQRFRRSTELIAVPAPEPKIHVITVEHPEWPFLKSVLEKNRRDIKAMLRTEGNFRVIFYLDNTPPFLTVVAPIGINLYSIFT
jgi:hypothetical protein